MRLTDRVYWSLVKLFTGRSEVLTDDIRKAEWVVIQRNAEIRFVVRDLIRRDGDLVFDAASWRKACIECELEISGRPGLNIGRGVPLDPMETIFREISQ